MRSRVGIVPPFPKPWPGYEPTGDAADTPWCGVRPRPRVSPCRDLAISRRNRDGWRLSTWAKNRHGDGRERSASFVQDATRRHVGISGISRGGAERRRDELDMCSLSLRSEAQISVNRIESRVSPIIRRRTAFVSISNERSWVIRYLSCALRTTCSITFQIVN